MARKRQYKKRQDYRKGGRVRYQEGGLTPEAIAKKEAEERAKEFADEKKSMNPDGTVKPTIEEEIQAGTAQRINPATGQTIGNIMSTDGTSGASRVFKAGESYTNPAQTQQLIDQNKLADPNLVDTDIAMGTTTFDSAARADAGADVTATTVDAPEGIDPATYQAQTVADQAVQVDAATGTRPDPITDIQGNLTAGVTYATSDDLKVKAAEAQDTDFAVTSGYLVDELQGEDTTGAETPDAENQTREAITGEPAPDGVAAAIEGSVGYEAAKRREVKGTAAQGAAAEMIAETAGLPPEISAAIVDDPAQVEAQIASEDVTVQAAVAALPTEALVS